MCSYLQALNLHMSANCRWLRVDRSKRTLELGGHGIAPCWLFEGLSLGLRADLRILWNEVVNGSWENFRIYYLKLPVGCCIFELFPP